MAFQYRARRPDTIAKRAEAKGAGDFETFFKGEWPVYSPKNDQNYIRILPPTWDDPEHYGMTIHAHYGVGPDRAAVLCPLKMYGNKCPICEARVRAERAQADEATLKELKVTTRVLVWLLDMDDEPKGPQLWAMPFTVDRDICKISRDRKSGETYIIDHPQDGYDVSFDKTGKQMLTKYSGYILARRPSSVAPEWLDYIEEHPLPAVLQDRTYEEIKALFEGGVPEDDAPATPVREPADARPARPRVSDPQPEDRPARARPREQDDRPARSETARAIDDDIPFEGAGSAVADGRPRERARPAPREEEPQMSSKERAAALREKYAARN